MSLTAFSITLETFWANALINMRWFLVLEQLKNLDSLFYFTPDCIRCMNFLK